MQSVQLQHHAMPAPARSPSRTSAWPSATQSIIIGFNVRPDVAAKRAADAAGVDIRFYNIIYNLLDEVKAAMKGLLAPSLPGGHRRLRRGARDLQAAERRCRRRACTCSTARSLRNIEGARAAQRHRDVTKARSNRSSASRTMCAKWRPATSADSASTASTTSGEGPDRVLPPRRNCANLVERRGSTSIEGAESPMSRRTRQVGEFLKEELTDIIRREVKDPRIGFYEHHRRSTCRPICARRGSTSACSARTKSAKKRWRRCDRPPDIFAIISSRGLRMRQIPELEFRDDRSMEHAADRSRARSTSVQRDITGRMPPEKGPKP